MRTPKEDPTMAKRKKGVAPIYQLRVALRDIRPPVWRRVLVPGDVTLAELHEVVQDVMGWLDYHLWEFTVDGEIYTTPSIDEYRSVIDAEQVTLQQVAPNEGDRLHYLYDLGDSWEHVIEVEAVLPPDPEGQYPVCVEGGRACPPEDVGGVSGYYYFLEAIRDPRHEEHESYLTWVGGAYDPEAFDVEEANARLATPRT